MRLGRVLMLGQRWSLRLAVNWRRRSAEFLGQLGFDDGGVEWLGIDALEHHGGRVVGVVGQAVGQELEGEDAEGEDVDPLIDRLAPKSSGAMYCSVPVRLPGRRKAGVLGTARPKSISLTCCSRSTR